ncbi:MAG: tryptophan-rich sensory protein [Gammaproteobacteria bacterium]|nr:tryptophan-rich sensory protein [Gammaproteobacteria bacterium]
MVAGLGALASINAGEFYGELTKPSWAPPGWLFGPVWTLLYIIMAFAAWLAWRPQGYDGAQLALSIYMFQMVFNALWSWLFFSLHSGMWALLDISLLWICLVLIIPLFWKISILAGLLMIPYLFWVSFAAILNYSIWKLNPGIL